MMGLWLAVVVRSVPVVRGPVATPARPTATTTCLVAKRRRPPAALDAYSADGYVFHGPDGDLDYPALKSYLAALRDTFADFRSRTVLSCLGDA